MHVISNDRALAHWRALNDLPPSALSILKMRFLREQPILASIALPLTDGLNVAPDGTESLPKEDDPKLESFWRVATVGAIINEILCREAGRPLRKLTEPEVLATAESSASLFEQFTGAPAPAKANQLNVFTTCAQRFLLTGAAIALSTELGEDRVKLPRELLTLRILVEGLHLACGDAPATSPRTWDAERIQFALSTQGDPLRREALAACDGFRAELVTDFRKELDWWVAAPTEALEVDGSLGMHAMFLLASWREESAWPVFRKLFSLPGDTSYDLLGGLITEDGSVLLAMVGGKRADELRAMVEDEALDQYCRTASLDALTSLVAWGELPRAEHVSYLRDLLITRLRDVPANKHIFAGVVSAVCDLEAWELRPEVEAVYERGVVDEGFVDLKYFRAAADDRRSQWLAFCTGHQMLTDVPAATKWLDDPAPEDDPGLPLLDEDPERVPDSSAPYIAPPKVGRNEPCPCGSGRKFKKCCGK